MPLTHTRELFAKALKGKYALGAFNVNNMELLQAIIEACEEEKNTGRELPPAPCPNHPNLFAGATPALPSQEIICCR